MADINTGKVIISKFGIGRDNDVIKGIGKGVSQFKDRLIVLTHNDKDQIYDLVAYSHDFLIVDKVVMNLKGDTHRYYLSETYLIKEPKG